LTGRKKNLPEPECAKW